MHRSILLVEDDFYIRDLYVTGITKVNGYTIDAAEDGKTATQKLSAIHYDFILLDVMLPDTTGIEILKTLRTTDGPNKTTPVYMFTNAAKDGVIKDAFSQGADGFLVKVEHTPKDVINEIEAYFTDTTRTLIPPTTNS
jgi:DNA-binding response OmpR family regulator